MTSAETTILISYFAYLAVLSLMALLMYYSDKQRAKKGKYRMPEVKLLGISWLGGALGAFLGMRLFRHKTKHIRFCVQVPASLILWSVISFGLCVYLLR